MSIEGFKKLFNLCKSRLDNVTFPDYLCHMNVTNEDQLYQIVGRKIKYFREQLGMNQTVLASRVQLSRTSVVNIEQGKQHGSLFLLWTIAKAVGVEFHDLLPERENTEPTVPMHWEKPNVKRDINEDSYSKLTAFINERNKP